MSVPAPHRSFLVTSIGAYDDSGFGTGGLSCVHDGAATVIDKIDSTGLFCAGSTIYRFARGLQAVVAYEAAGLRAVLRIPEAKDVHDVLFHEGQFVCVSTGTNEVLWIDAFGQVTRRWKGEGQGDAWHLNCLCRHENRLFLSAFGRFASHREWVGKCSASGFIVDLNSLEDVVTGLSGPHNPRWIDGQWVVCDSHTSGLVLQTPGGERRQVTLEGFTRGFAHDAHFFYVGESANRKANIPADYSHIAVLDRRSLEMVERFRIPFPEIYEIVLLDLAQSRRMSEQPEHFQIEQATERVRALETQVELGLKEIEQLRFRLDDLKTYAAFKGALTQVKRRLVG